MNSILLLLPSVKRGMGSLLKCDDGRRFHKADEVRQVKCRAIFMKGMINMIGEAASIGSRRRGGRPEDKVRVRGIGTCTSILI